MAVYLRTWAEGISISLGSDRAVLCSLGLGVTYAGSFCEVLEPLPLWTHMGTGAMADKTILV